MKREGNLMERIADPHNLRLAFWKARKGKNHKREVEVFRDHLDANLLLLRNELLSGTLAVGKYRRFRIKDPKEREICAAEFRERVLHHAMMNVCHANFERFQIFDSYATRIGKGQFAALERAKVFTRQYAWFCKLDVHKFFDSIHHGLLKEQLERRFKDQALLSVFNKIIDSYCVSPNVGLPIGNLTSQYFANFYLAHLDHYIKETLQQQSYVRYMDDMVLWNNCKAVLLKHVLAIESYINNTLRMTLNPKCINTTLRGVPMLGFVVFPKLVRLNKHSKQRFIRRYKHYNNNLLNGLWSQKEYAQHIEPLVSFTRFAESRNFRTNLIHIGDSQIKIEPCVARRQLEQ